MKNDEFTPEYLNSQMQLYVDAIRNVSKEDCRLLNKHDTTKFVIMCQEEMAEAHQALCKWLRINGVGFATRASDEECDAMLKEEIGDAIISLLLTAVKLGIVLDCANDHVEKAADFVELNKGREH